MGLRRADLKQVSAPLWTYKVTTSEQQAPCATCILSLRFVFPNCTSGVWTSSSSMLRIVSQLVLFPSICEICLSAACDIISLCGKQAAEYEMIGEMYLLLDLNF